MSFPRAKLRRFNDAKSCAPAPGSYHPRYEEKCQGAGNERTVKVGDSKKKARKQGNLASRGKSSSLTFKTPVKCNKKCKQDDETPLNNNKVKNTYDITELQTNALCSEFDHSDHCTSVDQNVSLLDDEYCQLKVQLETAKHEMDYLNSSFDEQNKYKSDIETLQSVYWNDPKNHCDSNAVCKVGYNMDKFPKIENVDEFEKYCNPVDVTPLQCQDLALVSTTVISQVQKQLFSQKADINTLECANFNLTKTVQDISIKNDELSSIVNDQASLIIAKNIEYHQLEDQCGVLKADFAKCKDEVDHNMETHAKFVASLLENEMKFKELYMEGQNSIEDLLDVYKILKSSNFKAHLVEDNLHTLVKRIYERRRKVEDNLRATLLQRDELRVSNIDSHVTIVELQDKIIEYETKVNTLTQELISCNSNLQSAENQCARYKLSNANLQSSLNAVVSRLSECYTTRDNLQETVIQLESEKLLYLEQSQVLSNIEEEAYILQQQNLQLIQDVSNKLHSEVDCLRNIIQEHTLARQFLSSENESLVSQLHDFKMMEQEMCTLKADLIAAQQNTIALQNKLCNTEDLYKWCKKLRCDVISMFTNNMDPLFLAPFKEIIDRNVANLDIQTTLSDCVILSLALIKPYMMKDESIANNIVQNVSVFQTIIHIVGKLQNYDSPNNCDIGNNLLLLRLNIAEIENKQLQLQLEALQSSFEAMLVQEEACNAHFEAGNVSVENKTAFSINCGVLEQTIERQLSVPNTSKIPVNYLTVETCDNKHHQEIAPLLGTFAQLLHDFKVEYEQTVTKGDESENCDGGNIYQKYAKLFQSFNNKQKLRLQKQFLKENDILKQEKKSLDMQIKRKDQAIEKLKHKLASQELKENRKSEPRSRNFVPLPLGENSPRRVL